MTVHFERINTPTSAQIDAAAARWCGEKERETFYDDILYFRNNWQWFAGLRRYVDEEVNRVR